MICVAVSGKSQLEEAVRSGCSMLELRLDLIGEDPEVLLAQIPRGMKVIATYRPGEEDEIVRYEVLKRCIELGASLIDLEEDSEEEYLEELVEYANLNGCQVILSYHNFHETPPAGKLREIMEGCYMKGADIAKIATMIHSPEDAARLLSLHERPGRKVIIGMGEAGRITRLAAPYLGSEFTFASVEQAVETAPGQFTVNELRKIYSIIEGS